MITPVPDGFTLLLTSAVLVFIVCVQLSMSPRSTGSKSARYQHRDTLLGVLFGGAVTGMLISYANLERSRPCSAGRVAVFLPWLVAGAMGYVSGVVVMVLSQRFVRPLFVDRVTSPQYAYQLVLLYGLVLALVMVMNVLLAAGLRMVNSLWWYQRLNRSGRSHPSEWSPILYGIMISLILSWIPVQDVAVVASQRMTLFRAAARGEVEWLDKLLKQGVSAEDPVGDLTPLMASAGRGRDHALKLLLDHGVRVDTIDEQGFTALHWSALMGSMDTTRLLLTSGADPLRKNSSGETPIFVAARRCHLGLVEMLMREARRSEAHNNPSPRLRAAVQMETVKIERALSACR